MKRNCNFQVNPAFAAGLALLWAAERRPRTAPRP